ncbi:MAG: VOC family protein [Cyclobacteriaceae bacterium]|nr:VOC family protein [Cyclobacteriaceae bacterium HetDA_MAG_MS6]
MEQNKFHIGLHVSDIERTVVFYQDLFGVEPVKVKTDYAKFELDNPGLVISFIQSPAENILPLFGHLGLRVNSTQHLRDKKQAIEKRLEIALEEDNTACCYAKQDKFWVNDPDGYAWEVYHFKEDVEQKEKKYSASPCC